MNPNVEKTLRRLIANNFIPETGLFDITEDMISLYVATYGGLNSKLNTKFDPIYARKLAGLNLLKLKFSRGGSSKTCKEGLVYLISNPAWEEHLKIGMTVDLVKRLASYQVYDPLKKYKVLNYEFVLDRKKTEDSMLKSFNIHLESGEWIKYNDSIKIIQCVRSNGWNTGV